MKMSLICESLIIFLLLLDGIFSISNEFVPDDHVWDTGRLNKDQSTIIRSSKSRSDLTILSVAVHDQNAIFHNPRNKRRPFWIDYSIDKDLVSKYSRLMNNAMYNEGTCSLEILGVMPKSFKTSDIAYLKYSSSDNSGSGVV